MADNTLFRDEELHKLASTLKDRLNFYGNRDFNLPLEYSETDINIPLVKNYFVTDQLTVPVINYPIIRVFNNTARIRKDTAKARRNITVTYELVLPHQELYQAIAYKICKYMTSILNDMETLTGIPIEDDLFVFNMRTSRVELENALISLIDTNITIRSGI